jgi:hypothetical protein
LLLIWRLFQRIRHIDLSAACGNADGDDVSWTNTHMTAGKTATIQSGGDAHIQGGVTTLAAGMSTPALCC